MLLSVLALAVWVETEEYPAPTNLTWAPLSSQHSPTMGTLPGWGVLTQSLPEKGQGSCQAVGPLALLQGTPMAHAKLGWPDRVHREWNGDMGQEGTRGACQAFKLFPGCRKQRLSGTKG